MLCGRVSPFLPLPGRLAPSVMTGRSYVGARVRRAKYGRKMDLSCTITCTSDTRTSSEDAVCLKNAVKEKLVFGSGTFENEDWIRNEFSS